VEQTAGEVYSTKKEVEKEEVEVKEDKEEEAEKELGHFKIAFNRLRMGKHLASYKR